MDKLRVALALCCAVFACSSAAPQSLAESPGSEVAETKTVEASDNLQEEIDSQESILSKVRRAHLLFQPFTPVFHYRCLKNSNLCGNYIRALLFVAAG